MSTRSQVRWLHTQLPELVARGILDDASAERLRTHYREGIAGPGLAVRLFAVLGALLVGGGIILLVAHNWSELGRPARTVLSILPLLAAQVLAGWVVWTRRGRAWREGTGVFWVLALGAGLALVEQTYHLPADSESFLLRWTLLTLPVVYLLRSGLAALLYLVGITAWAPAALAASRSGFGYWGLLAALVPFLWLAARARPITSSTALLGWALPVSLAVGLGVSVPDLLAPFGTALYAALALGLFLAGSWWPDPTSESGWHRPLRILGGTGIVLLALLHSYAEVSRDFHRGIGRWFESGTVLSGRELVVVSCLALVAGGLTLLHLGRRHWVDLVWVAGALAVAAGLGLPAGVATWIANLVLFALGVVVLVAGVREDRLGQANVGMAILSALILARFFDADLDILFRALGFIALGLGFLATNVVLVRRRRLS